MLTTKYPIKVLNPEFPAEVLGETSPISEAILILNFKGPKEEALCPAVLLPVDAEMTIRPEPESALYPIFTPDADVQIRFGYHADTINRTHTMLAFITTRSITGETLSRVHGL